MSNFKSHLFYAVKIATTATIAILIATFLKLDNPFSAGIVAILSIASTKKETVNTALQRLIAFTIAIIIATISFYALGFGILGFYVYLLIYILICHKYKWYSSIAMNSVLISHFLGFGKINLATITNEVLLFVIGVGLGIVSNLYLKQNKEKVEKLQQECDLQIQLILKRLSEALCKTKLENYDGSCFVRLDEILNNAKKVANNNYLNQFSGATYDDLNYLIMRETQMHVLKTIYNKTQKIHQVRISSKSISKLLEQISQQFHKDNDCLALKEKILEIHEYMSGLTLPATRDEFEDRAILFSILHDINEVIDIKLEYKNKY